MDRRFHFLVLVALAFLAVYAVEGRLARGIYNDDDIGHYLLARDAVKDPALFLSVWGRPLFTLVYALPAQIGFAAVRLVSALITALAVVATGVAGARLGRQPALAAGLLGTMPFVLLLSYSSLTEPLCALVVASALAFWFSGRPGRAFLLAALVPLARLELILLVGIWGGIWLVRKRDRRILGLVPFSGIAGWALAGAMVHGDLLWLPEQIFTGGENLYGQTDFWHYPRGLIYVIGPVAFLFVLVDLVERAARRRIDLLAIAPVAVLALYLVFSWKLSLGHAAGFLRHLVAVAPVYALAAARGLTTALTERAAWRRAMLTLGAGLLIVTLFLSRALVMHHKAVGPFEVARIAVALAALVVVGVAGRGGNDQALRRGGRRAPKVSSTGRERRVAAASVALVAVAFGYALGAEPPLSPSPEQEAVLALHDWFEDSQWVSAPLIAGHPWFLRELAARGRLPYGGLPPVKRTPIEEAQPGTVIIWDSHYSLRPPEGVDLAYFKFDSRFRMLRESIASDRRFAAYALLKEHAERDRE